MKPFLQRSLALAVVAILSFALWGLWKQHQARHTARPAAGASVLRVLTLKGVLPSTLTARFAQETGTRLLLTEVDSPDEIWSRILNEAGPNEHPHDGAHIQNRSANQLYDVITLFSYQSLAAAQLHRVGPLQAPNLENSSALAVDFQDLPGSSGLAERNIVPILWGLTGFVYDTSRWQRRFDSWMEIFAEPKTKNKVTLLNSPVDIMHVLVHRYVDSKIVRAYEDDGNPDEHASEIKKILTDLGKNVRYSKSGLFSDEFKSAKDLPPEGIFQINHGTAASLLGSGDGLKDTWRFVIPREKALFWVMSFALADGTSRTAEAHRFLDFVLDPATALEISRQTRQASANKLLDSRQDLHPWLKPSYLRQIELGRLHVIRDFHAGPFLRAAIQSAQRQSEESETRPTKSTGPKPAAAHPHPVKYNKAPPEFLNTLEAPE